MYNLVVQLGNLRSATVPFELMSPEIVRIANASSPRYCWRSGYIAVR